MPSWSPPGNLEDNLDFLKDCDLIIEAVLEDPQVKRDLYAKVEAVRKDGSIVSSNTSTIPLAILTEGLPKRFAQDFLVTHFFQPAALYAAVGAGRRSRDPSDAVKTVEAFGDEKLGKGIVPLQGHAGLHRQPHRHLLDPGLGQCRHGPGPDRRGSRRRDG